ncbi:hypothetical protein [Aeromonas phage AerS_266]|nr:hypothetical protein [Aeromonas phage AerS_266]
MGIFNVAFQDMFFNEFVETLIIIGIIILARVYGRVRADKIHAELVYGKHRPTVLEVMTPSFMESFKSLFPGVLYSLPFFVLGIYIAKVLYLYMNL